MADGEDILDEATAFILEFGSLSIPFLLILTEVGVSGVRQEVRADLVAVLVLEGREILLGGREREETREVEGSSKVENDVVVLGGWSFGLCCRVREGSGWLRHGGCRGKVELVGRHLGCWRSGKVVEGIERRILILEEVMGRGAFGKLRWDAGFELDRSFCEADESEC